MESLCLFNDEKYQRGSGSLFERTVQLAQSDFFAHEREVLVSIGAFKLMENHFHLFLREEKEAGTSRFMHRLGTGFTNYFNLQQNRSGSLFEGPFQAVHIQSEAHFNHIVRYMHLNELDKYQIPWREGVVSNWGEAIRFLDRDPYSSHALYMGGEQRLPIVDLDLVDSLFSESSTYLDFLKSWSQRSLTDIPEESLEFR
jgi:REP element-mobilizing transposase RayT